MTLHLLALFFLLILLFLLSRKIPTYFYGLLFLITKSERFSVGLLAWMLLPGTLAHEMSHFILASILRVPTGEISILPSVEKSGEVKAGKLMIGETDPFRRTVIGLAPVLIGLVLIYLIGYFFLPSQLSINPSTSLGTGNQQFTILGSYLLFVISTTMFSSKKDLESLIIAGPITFLIFAALYYTGVRIFLEASLTKAIATFTANLNFYLIITSFVDFTVYIFLALSLSFWQKISGRKIIH